MCGGNAVHPLGFGFILCNSPRLILLSASAPRDQAATVQSIGSATANLGGALAYSFMMTLVAGFGLRAYVQTLESFGLSQAQITSRLIRLAEFGEQISVVVAPEDQTEILREIDFWLVKAYVTGLSQAMLVLGVVCLFSAAIVYLGLNGSQQGGSSSYNEKAIQSLTQPNLPLRIYRSLNSTTSFILEDDNVEP